MTRLIQILSRASITNRAEARSGEALFWNDLAQSYAAMPIVDRRSANDLRDHGWTPTSGKPSTHAAESAHRWAHAARGPVFIADPSEDFAFSILTNERGGYTLLSFARDSSAVHRRDGASIASLYAPNSEWAPSDWNAYPGLLKSVEVDVDTFWRLPALTSKQAQRPFLLDTLAEGYWHNRITHNGLESLLGDNVVSLRSKFLDSPSRTWLEKTASHLNLTLNTRHSMNLATDVWLLSQAKDEQLVLEVLPAMRGSHPEVFGAWADARMLALLRSGVDSLSQHIRAHSRQLSPRYSLKPTAPLDAQGMRTILIRHYGEPVISTLERAGRLHIITTGSELPKNIRELPNQHLISGINIGGEQVYMVADRVDPGAVPGLFMHEVGEHAGLAGMLGPDYGRMSAHFQRLLRRGDYYATWAAQQVPSDTPAQHVGSERLAYLIERVVDDEVARPGGEDGYALGQQCLSNLKTWLFRTPLCRWLDEIDALDKLTLSPKDIASMAREAVDVLASSLNSDIRIDGNEWSQMLDDRQLEALFSMPAGERQQYLAMLPSDHLAGYLFALASADAPEMVETIEHFAPTLNDMAIGAHGQHLSSVAGEVLALGYALETRQRAAAQLDRQGFAMWQDPTATEGLAQLSFLTQSPDQLGEWQLAHYSAGAGQYLVENFMDAAEALKLITPGSIPIPDASAPETLNHFSQPAPAVKTAEDALTAWAQGTTVVDENGRPAVFYHGTGSDFSVFDGFSHWAAEKPELASEYAFFRQAQSGIPSVMPVYVRAVTPFDGDSVPGKALSVSTFFKEAARQAKAAGRTFELDRGSELLNLIRECSQREESGPYFSKHQFWNQPEIMFGRDGANHIKELFQLLGFDSIRYTEADTLTVGVLDPGSLKSAVGNLGLFDPANPDIRYSFAGRRADNRCLAALDEARMMQQAGDAPELIWKATGWLYGRDEMWRFEIDDSQSAPKENWSLWGQNKRAVEHRLCDLIDFWPLFDAYSDLRYQKVVIDPSLRTETAMYGRLEDTIYLFAERGEGATSLSKRQLSSLHHELQHKLQEIEGFSPGGSPFDQTLPASKQILQNVNDKYSALKVAAQGSDAYQQAYRKHLAAVPQNDRYREGRNGTYDHGAALASEAAYQAVIQPIEVRRLADIDRLLSTFGVMEGMDNSFLTYRLISGEVEARNVQARLELTAGERRESFPITTEDVPSEYVLVWHGREVDVSAPAPGKAAASVSYSFSGERSGTARIESLAHARALLGEGADPEQVRQETGWFVGHDQRFRYEIDDSNASLIDPPIQQDWTDFYQVRRNEAIRSLLDGKLLGVQFLNKKQFKEFQRITDAVETEFNRHNRRFRRLDELLDHPELFEAYPSLRNVRVELDQGIGDSGAYEHQKLTLTIGLHPSLDRLLSVLLHESQHHIQWVEDFGLGGSPERMRDIDLTEPRLKQINTQMQELLEADPDFGRLQRQANRDYVSIENRYGARTHGGEMMLDWDVVPDSEREGYFALLEQLETFPQRAAYWDLMSERAQVSSNKPVLTAFEQYRRLAGEVEARNVQRRMALTAQERMVTPPSATEDVPADVIVVVNGRDLPASTLMPLSMRQIEAPAFVDWFKDSVMTTPNGAPLVLYHGTDRDIGAGEFQSGMGTYGQGLYLTGHVNRAGFFARLAAKRNGGAPYLIPVYANLKNPLILESAEDRPVTKIDSKHLQAEGYDGVIIKKATGSSADTDPLFEVVVFDPRNVASAITNLGNHSSAKPALKFSTKPQVETEAFLRWFSTSQVADEDGRPLVMYHGTRSDIQAFETSAINRRFPFSFGFHFTSRREEASVYADSITNAAVGFNPTSQFAEPVAEGANVMPVYLRALNPLVISTKLIPSVEADTNRDKILEQLRVAELAGRPYDSVLIKREAGDEYDSWNAIVFQSTQVKSALGNIGGFEVENPSIRYRQLHQTETSEFKHWFGGSRVVDAMGEPLVLYHGTASDFSEFDSARHRSVLNNQYQGDGFHFSPDPAVASKYADASRNHEFNRDRIFTAVDAVMPQRVAAIFKAVTERGYGPAWDALDETETRLTLSDADASGVDINDLLDLIPYIEGNHYDAGRDTSWNTMSAIHDFFSGASRSFMDDSVRDMAVSLGLGDALPNQVVMPVYLKAENILFTSDPEEARLAQANGFDGVHYTGPDTVDGVGEWIVFSPAQVKSAIGNTGDFSSSKADIRFRLLDQTDTPEFKSWFGESQVQTADRTPAVVYHGTTKDFSAFDTAMIGTATDSIETSTGAFWFSDRPRVAENFATDTGTVLPVYLRIERPLIVDCAAWAKQYQTTDQALILGGQLVYDIRWFKNIAIAQAKQAGQDGVIFKGGYDQPPMAGDLFAAFSPTQIKSAIGNIGTFNPEDSDIRFRVGLPPAAKATPGTRSEAAIRIKPNTISAPVNADRFAEALRVAGRHLGNTFDGRALTPAQLKNTLAEPIPRALRSFMESNLEALALGESVNSLVESHLDALNHSIDVLRSSHGLTPHGHQRDLRVRELQGELGWFVLNRARFQHEAKEPAILNLDEELLLQSRPVREAAELLGFDRAHLVNGSSVLTGGDLMTHLTGRFAGASGAARILQSVGIDAISYTYNHSAAPGQTGTMYRVLGHNGPGRALSFGQRRGSEQAQIDMAGLKIVGNLEEMCSTAQCSVSDLIRKCSQRASLLGERSRWLERMPRANANHVMKNDAALNAARAQLLELVAWQLPGEHNCLPWDGVIPTHAFAKLEPHAPGKMIASQTGAEIFAVLASELGSEKDAQACLKAEGIIGAYSASEAVIWARTPEALSQALGGTHTDHRFHLAYHGTPHTVDRFSNAMIGTGEGAQAFGWGQYFADLQEVASHYQNQHVRKGFWYEEQRFKNIEDLIAEVVPPAASGDQELDGVLRRALHIKAYAPERMNAVMAQVPQTYHEKVTDVLGGVAAISISQVNDVYVMPAGGARAANANTMHEDADFRFGEHHLSAGLHWKVGADVSDDDLKRAFEEHVRDRTDVEGCREVIERITEALEAGSDIDYWESRLRDAQWELSLAEKALKALEGFGPFSVHKPIGTGNLYLVNLDIEPCEYLQYDSAFTDQAHLVQTALLKLANVVPQDGVQANARLALAIEENASGQALYRALSNDQGISPIAYAGGREASEALLTEGVQGIRYLDRTSRSAGGDTYNYVVFDDRKITVTGKNCASEKAGQPRYEESKSCNAMGMAM
jgi:hypothetical protein